MKGWCGRGAAFVCGRRLAHLRHHATGAGWARPPPIFRGQGNKKLGLLQPAGIQARGSEGSSVKSEGGRGRCICMHFVNQKNKAVLDRGVED